MITREEAIDKILELRQYGGLVGITCTDALDMAIDALEQEPCEDAISRQAVLDIVDSYSESRSNVEDVTQDMISDILALPPVNPQEKTGHWIYKQYDGYPECGNWHCSECDKIDNRTSAHCPNCGAKMVEPQERSDKE